ncbi:MAG: hypothetical protein Q8P56_00860, partial [Candidatus Uhrbacteria bacterium]|nr:hypothetical protein [Candidatus Uhrbacteria bacterium]
QLLFRMRGYETQEVLPEEKEVVIEEHRIANPAAALYENLRYVVDYQEEHAVRRSAIERILKRLIVIERKTVDARALLSELVEGGYLPRGEATRGVARQITLSINKVRRIEPLLGGSTSQKRAILSFAASEIESVLAARQHLLDDAVVQAFYKTVQPRIQGAEFEKDHLDVQVRCACRRALLGSDDASLSYALWLLYVPQWKEDSGGDLEQVAGKIPAIVSTIRMNVKSTVQWQIVQKIKKECIYFRIIREFVQRDGSLAQGVLDDPKKMEAATRAFLAEKYVQENDKARSSGTRAVSYLLITKIVLALIVELPYETYILGGVSPIPLLVNVLFHPLLLFGLTLEVVSLGTANTDAILRGMQVVLYGADTQPIEVYRRIRFAKTFALLYALVALGVFGAILAILQSLEFNVVSMALFYIFFFFVSYFTFRIRYNANRWKVLGDGTFPAMVNLLAVPVVRTGHWLSRKFSTVNIFVFILDFIIETPFRHMLSFWNQFVRYLRENVADVR